MNETPHAQAAADLEVVESDVLESLTRAEVDTAIATAHKFPRSISVAKKEMLELACLDQETAAACIFAKPQAGGTVKGPSVRLAEIALHSWGNSRAGARIIRDDGKTIVAQGVCHDLEKNVCYSVEVHRSVLKRDGTRFPEHLVVTHSQAAISIALRNAIFRVVPRAIVNAVYLKATETAVGTAETLVDRRTRAINFFTGKVGVPLDRVLGALNCKDVEDITLDDLATMNGLKTSLDQGEDVEVLFPPLEEPKAETKESPSTPPKSDKPKRKRRTKAEMEAARADEAEAKKAAEGEEGAEGSKVTPIAEHGKVPPAEESPGAQGAAGAADAMFSDGKGEDAAAKKTVAEKTANLRGDGAGDESMPVHDLTKPSDILPKNLDAALEQLAAEKKAPGIAALVVEAAEQAGSGVVEKPLKDLTVTDKRNVIRAHVKESV